MAFISAANHFQDTYAENGSFSATVPANCKLVLVIPVALTWTADRIANGSVTFGGTSMATVTLNADLVGGMSSGMFWLSSETAFATGATTVAWNWVGTGDTSGKVHFLVVYYDDYVTSLRDGDGAGATPGDTDANVTSPTIDAQSGDLVIAAGWRLTATAAGSWAVTSATERAESWANQIGYVVADNTATGSQTVNVAHTRGGGATSTNDIAVIVGAFVPSAPAATRVHPFTGKLGFPMIGKI